MDAIASRFCGPMKFILCTMIALTGGVLLISSAKAADNVAYYYDPLGRLIAKKATVDGQTFTQSYLYLGTTNQILQAKKGDGTIITYLDGNDENEHLAQGENGVFKGYITDHQGSVLNGEPSGASHRFGLFGEVDANVPMSPTSDPVMYGWQGLPYNPESGTWNNQARQYDPSTGTFTSQDPIGVAGGLNLYGSRKNNPLINSDPDGLRPAEGLPSDSSPDPVINPVENALNAGADALNVFPGDTQKIKAYRHCMASCLITKSSGASIAELLGSGYESVTGHESCRDMSNNEVGRKAAQDQRDCGSVCFEKVENGQTINVPLPK